MKTYIEALETLDWVKIHDASKKEARRQAGQMGKWLKNAEAYDLDDLRDFPFLVEPIKKATKYQYRIYNRNKEVKALDARIKYLTGKMSDLDLSEEEVAEKLALLVEARDEKSDIEAEQYTLAARILKIYCAVNGYVVLTMTAEESNELD